MEARKKIKRPKRPQAQQRLGTPRQKRHCAGVPPARYQHSPEVISQPSHQSEVEELPLTPG